MGVIAAARQRGSGELTPRGRKLFALCCLAVLAVSIESAYELAVGGPKLLVIIPLSALAGFGMVLLGLVNFEAFTFATITLRASLDIAKPDAGNSGAAGVATASASGLDPAGGLAVIFMLGALFWWLTRRYAGATAPRASVHRVALTIFALVGYLSIIDSQLPFVTFLEAVRVSAVAVMLAVMEVLLVNRASVKRLIAAIYGSALVPVGYTIFNILTHHSQFTSGGFERYQGTFSQPNPFAIYLCMLIVMGISLLPYLSPRRRVAMAALLAGSMVCLYYTYTRSAWVATVIGILAVAVMGRRRRLLAGMAIAACVAVVAVPTISQRFSDLLSSNSVNAAGNTSNSLAWRFDYWGEVLPLANKDPVTGIGLKMSSFGTVQAKEPHNDFLRSYVETGVVGIIAYLILLWSMGSVARHGVKRAKRGYDRAIAIGFAGNVISFVLISIVSNVITEVIVLWYYVAFAAAAYAVTTAPYQEVEEPELAAIDRRQDQRAAQRAARHALEPGAGDRPVPAPA